MENYWQHLRGLLIAHQTATGSAWSKRLIDEFRELMHKFWLVKPKAASLDALAEELRRAA
jgi:glutamate synthase (NADPH/NADH) large chain